MGRPLASVLIHVTFSTQGRQPAIDEAIEADAWRYAAAVCATKQCHPLAVGGTADHLHLLLSVPPSVAVAAVVDEVKTRLCQWVRSRGERYAEFAWQTGYGAFSIGQSQREALAQYIADQKQHHARSDFQDEFRTLLSRYGVDFDESTVWD